MAMRDVMPYERGDGHAKDDAIQEVTHARRDAVRKMMPCEM